MGAVFAVVQNRQKIRTMNFIKMHGLGNDFVILDQRSRAETLSPERIRHIADRRLGVGCDQVIVLEPTNEADLFMRIFNPDASEAENCGNATRCVAHLYMKEKAVQSCIIETKAGFLKCRMLQNGTMVEVDMGAPQLDWADIPLAREKDTLNLGIGQGAARDPVAVGMGNPHCVFFVDNVEDFDVERLGPVFEHHELYPNRTNVEFAEVLGNNRVRVRVWERGAGITPACGSGACAAAVASVRRGLTANKVEIIMDGGSLFLEWRQSDGHVLMTGSVAYVFDGIIKN